MLLSRDTIPKYCWYSITDIVIRIMSEYNSNELKPYFNWRTSFMLTRPSVTLSAVKIGPNTAMCSYSVCPTGRFYILKRLITTN